ncbi:MAG: CcdB family protein [Phycisphaerales bacterium]|nr:CcdB family protein [Phycisphaerales bacterium]
MSQFDVHRNANAQTCDEVPFLLDVQHPLLEELATRVVVPLVDRRRATPPIRVLNPEFTVEGIDVVALTQELAGIPNLALGPVVGNLSGAVTRSSPRSTCC